MLDTNEPLALRTASRGSALEDAQATSTTYVNSAKPALTMTARDHYASRSAPPPLVPALVSHPHRTFVSPAGVAPWNFEDRFGLLRAVFEQPLEPLHIHALESGGDDLRTTVTKVSEGIERFLTASLDVMMAARSDAELRESLHAYMLASDYGPHRGIASISAFAAWASRRGRRSSTPS